MGIEPALSRSQGNFHLCTLLDTRENSRFPKRFPKGSLNKIGGGDGDRTHDPFHAMEVLSQLSYAPNFSKPNPGTAG